MIKRALNCYKGPFFQRMVINLRPILLGSYPDLFVARIFHLMNPCWLLNIPILMWSTWTAEPTLTTQLSENDQVQDLNEGLAFNILIWASLRQVTPQTAHTNHFHPIYSYHIQPNSVLASLVSLFFSFTPTSLWTLDCLVTLTKVDANEVQGGPVIPSLNHHPQFCTC